MSQLLRGARVRARARRRASRHQAGEPDRHGAGRAQGRRLRHRAHRHVEPDDGRHGDRHAVVHVARAMPRPRDVDRALRPLQRRRRALRAPDRARSRSAATSRPSPTRSATRSRSRRRSCRRSSCRRRRPARRAGARQGARRALPGRARVPRRAARRRPDVGRGRRRPGHDDRQHRHADAAEAGCRRGTTRRCAPPSTSSPARSARWRR